MACVLVDVGNDVELLPAGTSPYDALEQGPVHSISLSCGWTLYWSSSSYQLTEVNEFATSLAKQTIKGDACLVHNNFQQGHLDELLQSRHRRLSQPIFEPGTPRCKSSSNACNGHVQMTSPYSQALGHGSTNCNSSNHAALKRARSMQHIAAANSTRQRILRGMSAARDTTFSHEEPYSTTPPQHPSVCTKPPLHTSSRNAAGCAHFTNGLECSMNSSLPGNLAEQAHLPVHDATQSQLHSLLQHSVPFHLHENNTGRQHSCQPSSSATVSGVQLANHWASSTGNNIHSNLSYTVGYSSRTYASNKLVPDEAAVCSAMLGYAAASSTAGDAQQQLICLNQAQRQQQTQDPAIRSEDEVQDVEMSDAVCSSSAMADAPAWDELSEDVVGRIASYMGTAVSAVMPVYLACRAWRRAVLEDDQLLLGLSFELNTAKPFKAALGQRYYAAKQQPHPTLLQRACKLGNVSALVTSARLLDAAGRPDEGMRCWRRAAKGGHVEGQLMYGLGLYRGIAGLGQDAEEAHIWLAKALRQVQKPDLTAHASSAESRASAGASSVQPQANGSTGTAASTSSGTLSANSTSVAFSMSTSSAAQGSLADRVLAQAGLVMGYLAFDGEGTIKVDRQEAVKYFRMAAGAGCREAEQVLGWIYSTGQYG